ncbi:MAG TPA: CDP-diacylglycerol--glycerol-3-phosphate 3-phosphatidyltransferase [bacterium]|nr:CDP-diacylglycerol--glycerol-3-phosphate 3-phosphatidyltransferase [bacterium]HPN42071.1 CDP-diacylglycerol--glycerol-3-phosphate 3-phosphatidyltransferase [bacterium]
MKTGVAELLKKDQHLFGLPNIITLSRLLFLPFIIYFLTLGNTTGDKLAVLFMFLSCVSDYMDGYFARKLDMKSSFGCMLDPFIDKIMVGSVMLVLACQKGLPAWFVIIVILRDLFILTASLYVIKRKRYVAQSNMLGKYTTGSFAIVIILFTINVPVVKYIAMWIAIILAPLSLIKYFMSHKETIIVKKSTREKLDSAE